MNREENSSSMRILSLLPSATEVVCALGARDQLVGRSEECDFPASVRTLPIVMRARSMESDLPSAEIDARVRSERASSQSLYSLDLTTLRSLRPEVILTQDLCGVCSVTDDEVREACRATGISPQIVSLTPRRLEEVWGSIERVGAAIGRGAEASALVERLRGVPPRPTRLGEPRMRVAVVEWLDPPILAGLWTPDMVAATGAVYVGPDPGDVGRRTDWESIAQAAPDWLILSPCSFTVERSRKELDSARLRREVGEISPRRGIVLADEAYFSRPGPRLSEGVQLIAKLVRGEPPSGPMPTELWGPSAPEVIR